MRSRPPRSASDARRSRLRAPAPPPDSRVSRFPLSLMGEKPLYTRDDLRGLPPAGAPGRPPFTRGIHESMYRGRLWTMRQFAGFGAARETNARYRYLLAQGQTGLSVAFDMPTLMGYDSDHPLAKGEVGREGVAVCTLDDMAALFRGIPLRDVSTSMTINSTAAIALAFYLAVAESQGARLRDLRGTVQNDILKEYIAQKEWIFPPRPSIRLITDLMAFCAERAPKWNTISISGYHIREAGSTAVQELAFTLADGFAYVEAGIAAGLDVNVFAPRLSFFFNAHMNFFEEIAKYRAARRIWARRMRERYKARNPDAWKLRFHTQTAGCSLTAQQPANNIVRTAVEALAGVLGGTQSLHTNSMDEALALPTEEAVTIALRTQQIIAHETGIPEEADPLGGAYYIEALTRRMEEEAGAYFREIEKRGGIVACIEEGYPQREIARASYEFQKAVERGAYIVVGVNRFREEDGGEAAIPTLAIGPAVERRQVRAVRAFKRRRDGVSARSALAAIERAARGKDNLMAAIFAAVKRRATLGEICDALRKVFGGWREPAGI